MLLVSFSCHGISHISLYPSISLPFSLSMYVVFAYKKNINRDQYQYKKSITGKCWDPGNPDLGFYLNWLILVISPLTMFKMISFNYFQPFSIWILAWRSYCLPFSTHPGSSISSLDPSFKNPHPGRKIRDPSILKVDVRITWQSWHSKVNFLTGRWLLHDIWFMR